MLWCAVLAVVAFAEDTHPPEAVGAYRPHALSLGVGHHYGGSFGVAYAYRLPAASFGAGVSLLGVSLQGTYHPADWRPLYVGAGVAPLVTFADGPALYGPDAQVGLDFSKKVVHARAALGIGFYSVPLLGWQPTVTLDLGVGVNVGR